jgi:hypothetical protein
MNKTDDLENTEFNLELQRLRLEENKIWFDYHRHMTTLNTGVIVIVATLVEKVFITFSAGSFSLIAASFYAFLGSIVFSVFGLGYHMPSLRIKKVTTANKGAVTTVYFLRYARMFLLLASLIGFLLGISFFIAFALRNVNPLA